MNVPFSDVLQALERRANGTAPYTFALDTQGRELRGEAWATCPACDLPRLKIEDRDGKAALSCLEGKCRESEVVGALRLTEAAPGDFGPLHRLDVKRMMRESPPPIPWVVEGLVVHGALTVLNGREGEGKPVGDGPRRRRRDRPGRGRPCLPSRQGADRRR